MLMRDSTDHLPFLEKCDIIDRRPNRLPRHLPLPSSLAVMMSLIAYILACSTEGPVSAADQAVKSPMIRHRAEQHR